MSSPCVYVERGVAGEPRAREFLARMPRARIVECDHYGEIFNRRAQDFRLQKRAPAWIVAAKNAGWVLPVPSGHGVGGEENYYFSHMLNCVYDCGYCFLQGMFRSANYLWFVNYEDFMRAIDERLAASTAEALWFFSGYDCDSLAAEPLTRFAAEFLPFFAARPRAWLELRTKSVQIESLLAREPIANCVVAFSFTPCEVHDELEGGVPSVERRIAALRRLAENGWSVGLRFDPLIWSPDFRVRYARLFAKVFAAIGGDTVHSASLGAFRLPRGFYSRMSKMMPHDALLAGPLVDNDGLVSYLPELEQELVTEVGTLLLGHLPADRFFPCRPPSARESAITSRP
jgi:spore photoproduct lyase